jgi:hypothetical protein
MQDTQAFVGKLKLALMMHFQGLILVSSPEMKMKAAFFLIMW